MKTIEYVKSKQKVWAEINGIELIGSRIDRGEKCYTKDPRNNFFRELCAETVQELSSGDGNELGDKINPGKIQALHSSCALAVNTFDYWRSLNNKSGIAKALAIPSTNMERIIFENKYPILQNSNKHPNIDIVIEYKNGNCCAIECKFTEPFYKRQGERGLKHKYLDEFSSWAIIPAINNLAKSISPSDNDFKYLDPAQLIKHTLGLLTKYNNDKTKFRLVYLYYASYGEEGYTHEKEIETFSNIACQDGISFQSGTWQDLILNLSKDLWNEHNSYVKYLFQRYL